MIEKLQELLQTVTGMRNHFRDFIDNAKRLPPDTPAKAVTGMWVIAKDSLSAMETVRARLENILKEK